jgi:hypothetical protein
MVPVTPTNRSSWQGLVIKPQPDKTIGMAVRIREWENAGWHRRNFIHAVYVAAMRASKNPESVLRRTSIALSEKMPYVFQSAGGTGPSESLARFVDGEPLEPLVLFA